MDATTKFNIQRRVMPTQIPKTKYKMCKAFVLRTLQADAAEKHFLPRTIDEIWAHQMFRGSKEYQLSKEESKLFIQNLVKEGVLAPCPLGGYMLAGQPCPSQELAEAFIKEQIKHLV